ncbi:hypothetical protein HMI54_004500 [Coelomomyces lativittatus]|nr:hypothetical protein HMI55_004110 [Coelomomyces lativittatus]KAJ1507069.1 hypothetical protein HMI54_004500 [Coelomomyces lativittatus]KAJ1513531.1 hypothetical protein HMI56_002269 [Coelomomyces lativittatus]
MESSERLNKPEQLLSRFDELLKQMNIEPSPLQLSTATHDHLTMVADLIVQALHQHLPIDTTSASNCLLSFLKSLTCDYLLPIHALAMYTVLKQKLLDNGLNHIDESNVETVINQLYSIITIQTTLLCAYGGSVECLKILADGA